MYRHIAFQFLRWIPAVFLITLGECMRYSFMGRVIQSG